MNEKKITSVEDLIEKVDEYGILQFWAEEHTSAWTLSGVNFNTLWSLREQAVNSQKIAYGKFVQKKTTFVSLEVLPYLCALRRDGYDFDSLADEGLAPNREKLVMSSVGDELTPSYALGRSLGIKGFDSVVTSLQNKTYLCLQFKKSIMGTALLTKPENIFGYDFVRSAYSLSPDECVSKITALAQKGLAVFDEKERSKILIKAI